jgi:hypothetical protein
MKIKLQVTGQHLCKVGNYKLIRDSKKYIKLDFSFSGKYWDDCIKTVVFKTADGKIGTKIMTSNSVVVPTECAASKSFKVSVFGEIRDIDMRITTNPVEIFLGASGYAEAGEFEKPLPSVYEQILDRIEALEQGGGITEEQVANLTANTEARHTHENKAVLDILTPDVMTEFEDTVSKKHEHHNNDVLDKLGETPDGLTFNQKPIGSASARPTAQKIISNIETDENYDVDFAFWSQPHGQNLWFYVGFFYKHPDFPEGTEIADFEVKIPDLNNGEYISFKHMIPFDQKPYLSMVDKVYYDNGNNCILQQLYNWGNTLHSVLKKAEDFEWESVRITYYTD